MPSKQKTSIGEKNDKVLFEHLASSDWEKPLSHIDHLVDWTHTDPKGNQIKREQVQSRLTYLRKLQKDNYPEFGDLLIKHLSDTDVIDIDNEDFMTTTADENTPPSKATKRTKQDNNDSPPTKKAKVNFVESTNSPATSTMTSSFNAKLYGLPEDQVEYRVLKPNPYMNGEMRIFCATQEILSDTKTANGGERYFSGFIAETEVELPYILSGGTMPVKAWLLNSSLLCIQKPVSCCRSSFRLLDHCHLTMIP